MTKATRETTKLNFITDQGSTRATVRCACRAMRLDCAFCVFCVLSAGTGLAAAAVVLPWPTDGEAFGAGRLFAAGLFAVVPGRRNARAGDDGEWGGGSGISQANAAGERDGGSSA